MRLVFGNDASVADWVVRRVPHMQGRGFGACSAIGVADGNTPVAGVVYHDYAPEYGTMQVSMAATTPRWAQRGIIYALLSYPFDQVGVRKLWSVIPSGNERSLKFNLGVGFTREGVLSRHFGRDHAVVTRMFRKDFDKRYKELRDGQVQRLAATGA